MAPWPRLLLPLSHSGLASTLHGAAGNLHIDSSLEGIPRRIWQNFWSHWKSQLSLTYGDMKLMKLMKHRSLWLLHWFRKMFRSCAGSFDVPSPERWSHQLRWLPRVPKSSKSDEFRRLVLKPMVTSGILQIPHHLASGYWTQPWYRWPGYRWFTGLPIKNSDFPWLC
jgi:hypothetical protein